MSAKIHQKYRNNSFSLREKVAEGRMRGPRQFEIRLFPLTLSLSQEEGTIPTCLLDFLIRKNGRIALSIQAQS